jgi:queuine tRNA-ribosyltransferase
MLGMRLLVLHNLYFYNKLMERIREAISAGSFDDFYNTYIEAIGTRI